MVAIFFQASNSGYLPLCYDSKTPYLRWLSRFGDLCNAISWCLGCLAFPFFSPAFVSLAQPSSNGTDTRTRLKSRQIASNRVKSREIAWNRVKSPILYKCLRKWMRVFSGDSDSVSIATSGNAFLNEILPILALTEKTRTCQATRCMQRARNSFQREIRIPSASRGMIGESTCDQRSKIKTKLENRTERE